MRRQTVPLVFQALVLLTAATLALPGHPPVGTTQATDDEIKSILRDRVAFAKKSVGIVVGVIDEKGARVISFGSPSQNTDQALDGNTVFEIGSVTKVFTATLLADMAERGEVNLNDPISKYLPKSVKAPTHEGKEITLLHLSSQASGLPRLPGNMAPKDQTNPYADYSVEQMYAFLSSYTLTRDPGAQYLYSNLGVGLLGHILTLRAGMDYDTLVMTRICQPLKMDNTRIKLTGEMKAHLATGHNGALQPVPNWDIPTLAGAGALRSTVNDMLKFVAANIGLLKSPLASAMQKTHRPQHETGTAGLEVGLGWHILKRFDTEIVWHNGGTGGYHSFIGFDGKKRRGVVVLSNSTNDIDDIGRHLLETQYPLAKLETGGRRAIKVDPKLFEPYVGEYQIGTGFLIKISREGDRLFGQVGGEEKLELLAETETDFFFKDVDVQITFIKSNDGEVTRLVLHQNRINQTAMKIR
ncbi:MAG TPA: serine hydrolase [Blastocatellia bacterium]|nr:serine hydrolase [Blastocatellia bacterium]